MTPIDLPDILLPTEEGRALLAPLVGSRVFSNTDGDLVVLASKPKRASVSTIAATLAAEGWVRYHDRRGECMPTTQMSTQTYASLQALRPPVLEGLYRAALPFFTGEGWVLRQPGLDHNMVLGVPPVPLCMIGDAQHPDRPQDLISTMFSDLRTTEANKQLLQVILCLMVGRAGLPEFPIVLVDAYSKNSGKSRLAAGMAAVVGSTLHVNDRKRLNQQIGTAAWSPGPHVILFDNINSKMYGELFSAGVHGAHISVEAKYQGLCRVYYPILLGTLNQGRVEHDLHDKAVWISLESNPGVKAIRFDPDPQTFGMEHAFSLRLACTEVLLKARLEPRAHVGDYSTRFIDWERAARAVARVLGYELQFDDGTIRDQLTIDILNALARNVSVDAAGTSAYRILSRINGSPRKYQDAYYALCASGEADLTQLRRLHEILSPLLGKELTFDKSCVILNHSVDAEGADHYHIEKKK